MAMSSDLLAELKRELADQFAADLIKAHERGYRDAIDVLRAVPTPWANDAADLLEDAVDTALKRREVTDDPA